VKPSSGSCIIPLFEKNPKYGRTVSALAAKLLAYFEQSSVLSGQPLQTGQGRLEVAGDFFLTAKYG